MWQRGLINNGVTMLVRCFILLLNAFSGVQTALTLSEIKEIISSDEPNPRKRYSYNAALLYASRDGHLKEVKELLCIPGIQINYSNKQENTPLLFASRNGHTEIVKLLLAFEEIQINHLNIQRDTALILASRGGHAGVVKLLLAYEGIKINQYNHTSDYALIEASRRNHAEVVALLAARKDLKVNQRSRNEETALVNASCNGYLETVKVLLERKDIDVNYRSGSSHSALMSAYDNVEIVKLLLTSGKALWDEMLIYEVKLQPIMWGILTGTQESHDVAVSYLYFDGQLDVNGWSSFIWASILGRPEMLKIVINRQAKYEMYNLPDKIHMRTALMHASYFGHAGCVELLLALNIIDVNAVDRYGGTALHIASRRGHAAVVELLLAHKGLANVGVKKKIYATKENLPIDANIPDLKGKTALFYGLHDAQVVRALLSSKKCDLKHRDNSGKTVIDYCTVSEIRVLLEAVATGTPIDHIEK